MGIFNTEARQGVLLTDRKQYCKSSISDENIN